MPTFSSADRGVEHGASRVESPAHPRVERLGLRARARRRGERRGMADQSVWASADVRWCGTCGNCDKCRSVHSVFTCGTCWRRFGVQPPNGKCPYDGGAVTIGTHNKPNNWWGPFAGDELRLKQRNRVRHTYTWDDDAKKMDGVPRDLRLGEPTHPGVRCAACGGRPASGMGTSLLPRGRTAAGKQHCRPPWAVPAEPSDAVLYANGRVCPACQANGRVAWGMPRPTWNELKNQSFHGVPKLEELTATYDKVAQAAATTHAEAFERAIHIELWHACREGNAKHVEDLLRRRDPAQTRSMADKVIALADRRPSVTLALSSVLEETPNIKGPLPGAMLSAAGAFGPAKVIVVRASETAKVPGEPPPANAGTLDAELMTSPREQADRTCHVRTATVERIRKMRRAAVAAVSMQQPGAAQMLTRVEKELHAAISLASDAAGTRELIEVRTVAARNHSDAFFRKSLRFALVAAGDGINFSRSRKFACRAA